MYIINIMTVLLFPVMIDYSLINENQIKYPYHSILSYDSSEAFTVLIYD